MAKNSDRHIDSLVSAYEYNMKSGKRFFMEASDLLDIIDYYLKASRTDDADSCLAFALQLHPDEESLLVTKAYRLKDKGFWDEAGRLVHRLSDQTTRDVQFFYIEEQIADFRLDDAEERMKNLVPVEYADDPEEAEFFIAYAEILLDYDLPLRALNWLERVTLSALPPAEEDLPGVCQKHCHELYSEAYFQLMQYTKAADALERAIDADPYDAVSWEQLADVHFAATHYEDALEACNFALDINPRSARALRVRCQAYAALQQIEELGKAVDELLKIDTPEYTFFFSIAKSLRAAFLYDDALQWIRKAARLCPPATIDYVAILSLHAEISVNLGKMREVVDVFVAYAVAAHQEPFPFIYNAAETAFNIGKKAEAADALQQALNCLEPDQRHYEDIVKLLDAKQCYVEAADVWRELFNLVQQNNNVQAELERARHNVPPFELPF